MTEHFIPVAGLKLSARPRGDNAPAKKEEPKKDAPKAEVKKDEKKK